MPNHAGFFDRPELLDLITAEFRERGATKPLEFTVICSHRSDDSQSYLLNYRAHFDEAMDTAEALYWRHVRGSREDLEYSDVKLLVWSDYSSVSLVVGWDFIPTKKGALVALMTDISDKIRGGASPGVERMGARGPIRLLSLFSGAGAFESALERLGVPYDLLAFSEIDAYATATYCAVHRADPTKNLGDISAVSLDDVPGDIDILTYGFPCQDLSIAGRKAGMRRDDGTLTRSGLFWSAFEIIKARRPRVAVAENVKNLLSKRFAADFKAMIGSLNSLGYSTFCKVLNAADYGTPQSRESFIVSIRRDLDDTLFSFPGPVPLRTRMRDLLETDPSPKHVLSEEKVARLVLRNGEIPTKGAVMTSDRIVVVGDLDVPGWHEQCRRVYSPDGLCPTLNTRGDESRALKVLLGGASVRRLTPLECWRLMGFGDDEYDLARSATVCGRPLSDTQMYRLAGNSIVVSVCAALIKRLLIVLLDGDNQTY